MRILIVEDEPAIANFVRQGLKEGGYAVDLARDGREGLDYALADDYLIKPFAFPELLARVRALLRRPPLQTGTILQVGDLEMDTSKREVCLNGRVIGLRPREYAVLVEYLMRHPNQVLTRTQIGEHVWNFDYSSLK